MKFEDNVENTWVPVDDLRAARHRLFNARWKSTPTWNFFHKPLRDVQALARHVARQGTVDEELKEGIKAIAKGTLASAKVQRELRSVLKEAAVY